MRVVMRGAAAQPDTFDRAAIRYYQPTMHRRTALIRDSQHTVQPPQHDRDFDFQADNVAASRHSHHHRPLAPPTAPATSHPARELSLTPQAGCGDPVPRDTLWMLQDHVAQLGVVIRKWDAREVSEDSH